MKDLKKELGELAIEILASAEITDASEQGDIRVDPNALFRFFMLKNLYKQKVDNWELTEV